MTSAPKPNASDIKVTDRFDLGGKNFLITGGGGGIGFACAKAIAQLGGGVAIIDMAPNPTAEFDTLNERYGVKTSYEVTQRTFNVNVLGTFWAAKLLAQHLVETNTPGSIVAIASINAQGRYVPVQPKSAYNASKAAIKGLMGPLAGELGQYGIRVNCISPGAIQTPLLARLEEEKRAILDWYRDGSPLQRLGVPEDLTPMVCYLLSDAAAFTTGADMLVTGQSTKPESSLRGVNMVLGGLHAGSARV
ncbi:hypothetical protein CEP54_010615 [Fusarium duplospermum]|uniref:Uncharacterized protein n=1 Tax=Fusarium duplospermum TaxID=1325734 RepID=A0A428PIT2_9HYPO|nr:hypothetical protein CEP54_010615 [Fusarium duplospermum]